MLVIQVKEGDNIERALKKYMKEKELTNQHYSTADIVNFATNTEEIEGWVPNTALSMNDANIKAVLAIQKPSRSPSPEMLREKRRSHEDKRRKEERRSSRDRFRNMGNDNFESMERPIKTRADTPLPEQMTESRRDQPKEKNPTANITTRRRCYEDEETTSK